MMRIWLGISLLIAVVPAASKAADRQGASARLGSYEYAAQVCQRFAIQPPPPVEAGPLFEPMTAQDCIYDVERSCLFLNAMLVQKMLIDLLSCEQILRPVDRAEFCQNAHILDVLMDHLCAPKEPEALPACGAIAGAVSANGDQRRPVDQRSYYKHADDHCLQGVIALRRLVDKACKWPSDNPKTRTESMRHVLQHPTLYELAYVQAEQRNLVYERYRAITYPFSAPDASDVSVLAMSPTRPIPAADPKVHSLIAEAITQLSRVFYAHEESASIAGVPHDRPVVGIDRQPLDNVWQRYPLSVREHLFPRVPPVARRTDGPASAHASPPVTPSTVAAASVVRAEEKKAKKERKKDGKVDDTMPAWLQKEEAKAALKAAARQSVAVLQQRKDAQNAATQRARSASQKSSGDDGKLIERYSQSKDQYYRHTVDARGNVTCNSIQKKQVPKGTDFVGHQTTLEELRALGSARMAAHARSVMVAQERLRMPSPDTVENDDSVGESAGGAAGGDEDSAVQRTSRLATTACKNLHECAAQFAEGERYPCVVIKGASIIQCSLRRPGALQHVQLMNPEDDEEERALSVVCPRLRERAHDERQVLNIEHGGRQFLVSKQPLSALSLLL